MARVQISRLKLALGLGILAILLGLFLIFLQIGHIRDLNAEKELERQYLAQAQATLVRLTGLRDNAPHYRQRLEMFNRMIPPSAGEEELLLYLHTLAGDHDLRVSEIRFNKREQGPAFETMPLAITVEGGYDGILHFLYRLRTGDRALRVNQLTVTGGEDTAGTNLTLQANAFYRTEDKWQ